MKPSENWEEERYFYEKLKQTKIFRYWKRVQFDCQTGKCAYCGKPMQYRYTETDHIKPLYYGGTSEADNLVLCHHNCNNYKSTRQGYRRPEWIKENSYSLNLTRTYNRIKEGNAMNEAHSKKMERLEEREELISQKQPQSRKNSYANSIKPFGIILTILLLSVALASYCSKYFSSEANQEREESNPLTQSEKEDETRKQQAQTILASYTNFYSNYVEKYPSSWSMPRDEFDCKNWPQNSSCILSVYGGAKVFDNYTYSVNSLEDGILFEQPGIIPHASLTNAALYKRARCRENGTIIGGKIDKNAAVVIELSDGSYYCVEN